MLKALWYWTGSIDAAIRAAKDMGANTMILKAGYHPTLYQPPMVRRPDFPVAAGKCRQAGLLVAAEIYNVPAAWETEGEVLRWAVLEHGAGSVILNMERPYEEQATGDGVRRL